MTSCPKCQAEECSKEGVLFSVAALTKLGLEYSPSVLRQDHLSFVSGGSW